MDDAEYAQHSPARRYLWQTLTGRLVEWLNRYQPSEMTVLISTALLVGAGAGLVSVSFRWFVDSITLLAFGGGQQIFNVLGRYYIILIPAIGGLIVGPLTYWVAREAEGSGVPEVMEAVAIGRGYIRPVVTVVKFLASAIGLGTGGSAGREGPVVQIGAAMGSTLGQAFRMSDERLQTLIACGAAGAISATFNTPVAGVFFALEIILGDFTAGYFSTVVIASVTADVVARAILGDVRAFVVPEYALHSPFELLLYVMLGLLAAPVAVALGQTLYRLRDWFDAWDVRVWVKPAVGGLGVGVIGLFAPEVFGVGYASIERVLHNEIVLGTALLLLVAKIVATALTLGSGGSGGVFAPSLFVGAMLGGGFGDVAHRMLPDLTAMPGAYALVGMAAVFAAAAQAPMTAIIHLFEMTGDYQIILPLMLSSGVATLLVQRFQTESIYTLKLARRGVRLERGQDVDVLEGVLVEEVMDTNPPTILASVSVAELRDYLIASHHHGLLALDENGNLVGIVTLQDLERAMNQPDWESLCVRDIMTEEVLTVFPDEPVGAALASMGARDIGRLPVVARENSQHLLGIIRRPQISKAYQLARLRRHEVQQRAQQVRIGNLTGTQYLELTVEPGSVAAGHTVQELPLPEEALLTTRRRGMQRQLLHGDDILKPGDIVLAFTAPECASSVRRLFSSESRGG